MCKNVLTIIRLPWPIRKGVITCDGELGSKAFFFKYFDFPNGCNAFFGENTFLKSTHHTKSRFLIMLSSYNRYINHTH